MRLSRRALISTATAAAAATPLIRPKAQGTPHRLQAPVRGAGDGIAEGTHKFHSAALGRNATEGGNIRVAVVHASHSCRARRFDCV
jgi:hypothetical protein